MNPVANLKLQQLSQGASPSPAKGAELRQGGADFAALLQDRLKVSGHAQTRLQSRDIQLDAAGWQRVMDGVDRAAAKGANESLVMIDDVALLVSVKNRTVITAVDQTSLKDHVFTNIDSAVIV
jgi:flagellar operon protein